MGRLLIGLTWSVAGALLLLAAGCGGADRELRAALQVEPLSWDSLRVEVRFAESRRPGEWIAVAPDELTLHVYDAAYDTLYAGPGPLVSLPDHRLGDGEHVVVEACGRFGDEVVCEQEGLTASPKRVRVDHDIRFPEDSDYARGSYDLQFEVERQRFGSEAWEPIPATNRVEGYLLAYVAREEGEGVKVPVRGGQGRFDLARYDNHRDFAYFLQSELYEHRQARVLFDVYAGLNGPPLRLASVEKIVRPKTAEDRAEEVRYFVEQATEAILEKLELSSEAYVYVENWDYDESKNQYTVAMEVRWRRSLFRRHVLEGRLEVGEDGGDARFRHTDGSREIEAQWRARVGGAVLRLASLQSVADRARAEEALEEAEGEGVLSTH